MTQSLGFIMIPNEKLSTYFDLRALTTTQQNADNTPGPLELANLKELGTILDDIIDFIGPFRVVSAYRSQTVNDLVGGAPNSLHMDGKAADLFPTVQNLESFYRDLFESGIADNLGEIAYKPTQGTVHISIKTLTKSSVPLILEGGSYRRMGQDELAAKFGIEKDIPMQPVVKAGIGVGVVSLIAALGFVTYRRSK